MSLLIHLIRHGAHADVGHVLSGRGGGSLTAAGRAQVERMSAMIDAPAMIQSSPQVRARETAAILARRFGRELEMVNALDEIEFGEWTGLSFEALETDPRWSRWNANRADAAAPGGETMAAAAARIVAHLDAMARRTWRAAILCVSHCDMIRAAIAHYLGLNLDNLLRFDIDPASLSTLSMEGGGARVVTLNRICA